MEYIPKRRRKKDKKEPVFTEEKFTEAIDKIDSLGAEVRRLSSKVDSQQITPQLKNVVERRSTPTYPIYDYPSYDIPKEEKEITIYDWLLGSGIGVGIIGNMAYHGFYDMFLKEGSNHFWSMVKAGTLGILFAGLATFMTTISFVYGGSDRTYD